MTSLGRLAVERRRAVLIVTALAFVVSIALGGGVADRLGQGGFDDPDSDSVQARAELDERFNTGFPDLVVLATVLPAEATVDSPDAVINGLALTDEIAAIAGTDDVVSYWNTGDDSLRSVDGNRALILFRLTGDENDLTRQQLVSDLVAAYSSTQRGTLLAQIGGREAVFDQTGTVIEEDLALAEAIAIPATFILLIIVFGTVAAALLPIGVGVVAAAGTFLVLHVLTSMTDVSIFALNLVTALGLGLAIDYSLLMVSRFREERAGGLCVDDAVVRTVQTAGRTIAFSGLTVAISLAALLVFPLYYLRSFAYAGIGVVALAMAISVIALPAVLSVLGDRINRWSIFSPKTPRHALNRWSRLGQAMTKRPWPVIVLSVGLLIAVAVPFLGVNWGEADDRALPADDPVRAVSDLIRTEFDSQEASAFPVIALSDSGADVELGDITGLALAISILDGVDHVDSATGTFTNGANIVPSSGNIERFVRADAVWFNVVPSVESISEERETLIRDVRELANQDVSAGYGLLVGGATAALIDSKTAIFDRIWIAGGMIVAATYVLLFLMFGSVLVPLKAIILNILSLGATFGMMVWVFQSGHGSGWLGFTATGTTDTTTPILMFCIAFGLSMDYEVFLLARMKEEYDRTGDNKRAIVFGLAKTGRLVTAAALLLAVTFLAFATSSVSTIKLFGIGLAVAVLIDAFIVRVALVPALMTVAGRWNWWAPEPLRRFHARFGLSESPADPAVTASVARLGDSRRVGYLPLVTR